MSAIRCLPAREGSRLNPIILNDDDEMAPCCEHTHTQYTSCSCVSERPFIQGYIPSYARGWLKAAKGDNQDGRLERPFIRNNSEQTRSHDIVRDVSTQQSPINTSVRTPTPIGQPEMDTSSHERGNMPRDAGRAHIPRYGPTSHLFASRFDYAWDNYGEGSSSTPAQPMRNQPTVSSKRSRIDKEEQAEAHAFQIPVDDDPSLRPFTKRRRNGKIVFSDLIG
ncbi:hypothetical protein F5X96DRAFT_668453 [Biscogniauxia mediterranea]|nr:hypothetical protein F5X96DRAFT_668453 [Biscogniauxia mediterranea]